MADDDATRFIWALKNGELADVKTYIEEKQKDVNTAILSRFPIHYAADYGHVEVLEYLLGKGADINLKDKHELTALHSAVYEGHTECVKLLLDKGAKETKNPDGSDLIEFAEKDEIKKLLSK